MTKLAKFLIEDLQGDWSKPSLKFFRSNDAYGYVIWLTLMYSYSEKEKITTLIVTQGDYSTVAEGEKRYKESYNEGQGWQPILIEIKKLVEKSK